MSVGTSRRQRKSVFVACMVVVVVARGFVAAHAWSPCPSWSRTRSPFWSLARGGGSLSLSNSKNDKDGPLKPATGWKHNKPSKSSGFWKSVSSTPGKDSPSSTNTDSPASSEEPRTGWLHNMEPPSESSSSSISSSCSVSPAQQRLRQAMKEKERNHRIVAPPAFHSTGSRVVVVTDHVISLPVDRATSGPTSSSRIDVYFSIAEAKKDKDHAWWLSLQSLSPQKRAEVYVQHAALRNATDAILYLQGGPGFGAPAPVVSLGLSKDSSWGAAALNHFSRIVLMDQRGTGRSTPITKQSIEHKFPDLFALDKVNSDKETAHAKALEDYAETHPDMTHRVQEALKEATNYMSQFRADNIVQDAEEIRDSLLLPSDNEEEPRPWGAVLGQSFGGFCVMSYLSQVEHPPKVCLLTGGIAPMLTPAYEAYDSLWDRVKERNLRYYEMYPGDIAVVKRIAQRLLEEPATLPSGGKLTARRFLQLGLGLGGSPSAFASLHSLLSSAFLHRESDNDEDEFTRTFLKRIDSEQSFDDNPIYFLMHESIYADGPKNSPTNWAAYRAYESRIQTPSEFDYALTSQLNSDSRPTMFFGEMVFPWMADGDFAEVSGLGMRSLAQSLASKADWGPLYDGDHMQRVLEDGTISRAAAAVYLDDMYVDFAASMKVAKRGGPLERCKVWVTNDYQHSGLRDDGANIFEKLLGMANGSVRTPS